MGDDVPTGVIDYRALPITSVMPRPVLAPDTVPMVIPGMIGRRERGTDR